MLGRAHVEDWVDVVAARRLGRRLLVYLAVGVMAAVGTMLVFKTSALVAHWFFTPLVGTPLGHEVGAAEPAFLIPTGSRWFVLLVPTVGGLLAGLLMTRFAPEVGGGGVGLVIDAYHFRDGKLRKRVPLIKLIASALTMGSGGSAGAEGPVAQVSAGMASLLAQRLNLSPSERRVLLVTGMAAGIGSAFHTPVAGALFATEVLYADMEIESPVLVPAILTTTVAYAVFGATVGWEPVVTFPAITFDSIPTLLPYTVLALVTGSAAIVFVKLLNWMRQHIGHNKRIPAWLRPAVGGFGVGIVGLFVVPALGKGYSLAQSAIDGRLAAGALFALAGLKMLATTLTVGSGGSGGKLSPSLVMGGALGGGVAALFQQFFPGIEVQPAAFVLVGMASFFGAASNTPLATIFLVSEIAGNYKLLVPSVWVGALAFILARNHGVFKTQPRTRLDAPPQLSQLMAAVLRRIRVRDVLGDNPRQVTTFHPGATFSELVNAFATSIQSVFPVVEPDPAGGERVVGVVDGRDLRRRIGEGLAENALIAGDLLMPAVSVTPDDTLYDAFARMSASGFTEDLVVTSGGDDNHLLGLLSRREVIAAYFRRIRDAGAADALSHPSDVPPDEERHHEGVDFFLRALERGGVLRGVRARTKAGVLQAIVEAGPIAGHVPKQLLVEQLLEREQLGSTGVGDGLALPHPAPSAAVAFDEPTVVIAPLERPVGWGSPDGAPVHTVILILAASHGEHLDLLGAAAKLWAQGEIPAALRDGANTGEVIERLRRSHRRATGKP